MEAIYWKNQISIINGYPFYFLTWRTLLADVLLCIPHKKGDISVIPNKKQLGKNGIHFFSNKETETYGFTKKRMFKYTNSPTNDKQRLFSTYHYSIGHRFYGNS